MHAKAGRTEEALRYLAELEAWERDDLQLALHLDFSVSLAALGRIDEGLPLFSCAQQQSWLAMCRELITPNFDITPEMMTHTVVVDPDARGGDVAGWFWRQDPGVLRQGRGRGGARGEKRRAGYGRDL